jgi:hypothetical protein
MLSRLDATANKWRFGRCKTVEPGQKSGQLLATRERAVLGRRIKLHPVARRKQHRLHPGILPPQPVQRRGHLLRGERQSFADLDRGVVMAATDDLHFHTESPPTILAQGIV